MGTAEISNTNPPERQDSSELCPFSGAETGIERPLETRLGPVTVGELETLVRNEWRRRLGPSSYTRSHPRGLVRSLVAAALDPDNRTKTAAATHCVSRHLMSLRDSGVERGAIEREFCEIPKAVRRVFYVAGYSLAPSCEVADRVAGKLRAILGLLDRDLAELLPRVWDSQMRP